MKVKIVLEESQNLFLHQGFIFIFFLSFFFHFLFYWHQGYRLALVPAQWFHVSQKPFSLLLPPPPTPLPLPLLFGRTERNGMWQRHLQHWSTTHEISPLQMNTGDLDASHCIYYVHYILCTTTQPLCQGFPWCYMPAQSHHSGRLILVCLFGFLKLCLYMVLSCAIQVFKPRTSCMVNCTLCWVSYLPA